jgi:hypothetical protein
MNILDSVLEAESTAGHMELRFLGQRQKKGAVDDRQIINLNMKV